MMAVLAEGSTSIVAECVSEMITMISTLKNEPLVALAFAVPITGALIGLAKRVFRRG